MNPLKDTPTRILDEAERLFAEKGYKATSLGEVATGVGIRTPSLYNHFRNKEALYRAVLDRLIDLFNAPLTNLREQTLSRERLMEWLQTIVDLHYRHPNFARLLQHAALADGPLSREIVDRLFRPLIAKDGSQESALGFFRGNDLEPWAVMAFNNIVMSYITMAPMYQAMLPVEPMSDEGLKRQKQLISQLADLVFSVEESG
ncbi:AcrR family transcriptional regulator [Litorivivens lipolytica]|uniref:AcrR family transcriptional regulator n=1 Tax=Litorivivens lipolytica TaxID=1524264 RepID=A0A7W4Z728_9GAMM|nr:TetR/AcrR family transcriptional regulator [Litorivivens lipolytica]MBB3047491.1 AcrR family transcriptional regulator [Litorivivens lipolytica]